MPPKKTKLSSMFDRRSDMSLLDRLGKKPLSGHFDPEIVFQFKRLAFEKNKSVQELLGEAIQNLFKKYKV
jgi:hypothetical protein